MCFHIKQTKTAKELEERYKAQFIDPELYHPDIFNAFTHPLTPVITNQNPNKIQLFGWGLIPHWAKDTSIQKSTLNARIETLEEKSSFKHVLNNRCLIPAEAFYEWQWLDSKGDKKQKYELSIKNNDIFSLAGLWSIWENKSSGKILNTYTILTTSANKLMSEIHNTNKRMPMIVKKESEKDWLEGFDTDFWNDDIIAQKDGELSGPKAEDNQLGLF